MGKKIQYLLAKGNVQWIIGFKNENRNWRAIGPAMKSHAEDGLQGTFVYRARGNIVANDNHLGMNIRRTKQGGE